MARVSPRAAATCERLSPVIKECSRCRVKVVKVLQGRGGVVAGSFGLGGSDDRWVKGWVIG